MITKSSRCKFNSSLLGFFSFSLMSVAVPAMAEDTSIITEPKPLIIPTGQLRDLQGIESKNRVGDFGGLNQGNKEIMTNSSDNPYSGRKIIVFYPSRQDTQPESSLTLEPEPTLIGDLTINQIVSEMVGQPDRSTIELYFR
ncbi:hypothetical protein C7H19_06535 [Aphanothece hegewaldii CCALA 016]|uniref:Uncharacterized protein n=1 Tax=Aphanothece hegewaldii CCALA 016 TaxID=2107694 RepID=A0A2T1M0C5_9CHRO|nr:hypothetical protein [Aphanothece hegewaldii]PSF38123.1 hypothetical protein C7H19_06535 [Aphanothece hegewaldii CCALA 016]